MDSVNQLQRGEMDENGIVRVMRDEESDDDGIRSMIGGMNLGFIFSYSQVDDLISCDRFSMADYATTELEAKAMAVKDWNRWKRADASTFYEMEVNEFLFFLPFTTEYCAVRLRCAKLTSNGTTMIPRKLYRRVIANRSLLNLLTDGAFHHLCLSHISGSFCLRVEIMFLNLVVENIMDTLGRQTDVFPSLLFMTDRSAFDSLHILLDLAGTATGFSYKLEMCRDAIDRTSILVLEAEIDNFRQGDCINNCLNDREIVLIKSKYYRWFTWMTEVATGLFDWFWTLYVAADDPLNAEETAAFLVDNQGFRTVCARAVFEFRNMLMGRGEFLFPLIYVVSQSRHDGGYDYVRNARREMVRICLDCYTMLHDMLRYDFGIGQALTCCGLLTADSFLVVEDFLLDLFPTDDEFYIDSYATKDMLLTFTLNEYTPVRCTAENGPTYRAMMRNIRRHYVSVLNTQYTPYPMEAPPQNRLFDAAFFRFQTEEVHGEELEDDPPAEPRVEGSDTDSVFFEGELEDMYDLEFPSSDEEQSSDEDIPLFEPEDQPEEEDNPIDAYLRESETDDFDLL